MAGTVCLTFDFDALSLWINRRQTSPASLSRGEFGAVAVPRILHLLSTYGIPSTWFIPGHTIETYRSHCEQVVKAGHEIGLHGYLHEQGGTLSEQQERDVFHRAFDLVANLTGQPPQGSRTPSWDLTASTVDMMLELGLLYDSSLMSNDYTPFFARRGDRLSPEGAMHFGEATRLVELPVSWSLDDYPHFEYHRDASGAVLPGLRPADDVFRNWTDDLVYMLRDFEDGVAVVTFHPQVIGRGHRLLALERWLDELGRMGVAFARCGDVARQVLAGRAYGTYRPATDRELSDNEIRCSCEKGARKMKEVVGWHALIPGPITRPEEALAFINECGFCTWGPVPRLSFPNLAEAMGETATSVLERTWSWKDDLHFEQKLYYSKIISGQPSFLAPDYLPEFISALAGRYLGQERDVTLYWLLRTSVQEKGFLGFE